MYSLFYPALRVSVYVLIDDDDPAAQQLRKRATDSSREKNIIAAFTRA